MKLSALEAAKELGFDYAARLRDQVNRADGASCAGTSP